MEIFGQFYLNDIRSGNIYLNDVLDDRNDVCTCLCRYHMTRNRISSINSEIDDGGNGGKRRARCAHFCSNN